MVSSAGPLSGTGTDSANGLVARRAAASFLREIQTSAGPLCAAELRWVSAPPLDSVRSLRMASLAMQVAGLQMDGLRC